MSQLEPNPAKRRKPVVQNHPIECQVDASESPRCAEVIQIFEIDSDHDAEDVRSCWIHAICSIRKLVDSSGVWPGPEIGGVVEKRAVGCWDIRWLMPWLKRRSNMNSSAELSVIAECRIINRLKDNSRGEDAYWIRAMIGITAPPPTSEMTALRNDC